MLKPYEAVEVIRISPESGAKVGSRDLDGGTVALDVDAVLTDLSRERRIGKTGGVLSVRLRRLPADRLLAMLLDHLDHDTLTREFLRAQEGE